MNPAEFNDIKYKVTEKGIALLTLHTPKRKNALSPVTFLELWHAVDHFEQDDNAHAMVITGGVEPGTPADKEAFSSGGYFNPDALEGLPSDVEAQLDLEDIAQKRTTLKFFSCHKPILAAVNGLTIGGAFTLIIAAADQIYLSEHAWAQLPFAKLGIAAELGSTFLLPRMLGMQKTKTLLYYPERLTPDQLVSLGIASAVIPHHLLLEHTLEQAEKLIPPKGAPLAIQEMKRCLNDPLIPALSAALDQENVALRKLMKSRDFAEGIMARIERRDAAFTGE